MKEIIPISFDPIFTGIFNDEENICIVENFLSIYFKIPLEKIKGNVKIKSRKLKNNVKIEARKEIDLLLDVDGRKINIELNNSKSEGVINRNIVYLCKVHGSQLKKGDRGYGKIYESIQINLNNYRCNEEKIKEEYYITNSKGKRLSEKLRIDLVDIVKAEKREYNEEEEKLARFLRLINKRSLEELEKEIGEDLMEKDAKEKLLEEVEKYNEEEDMYTLYSDYTKEERIRNTMIDEAREEGKEETYNAIVKNMLKKEMNIDLISELTNLTKEEIEKIREEM